MNDVAARKVVRLTDLPKPEQVINCKMSDQGELKYLRIINRAGKATGANEYYLNVAQNDCRPFLP